MVPRSWVLSNMVSCFWVPSTMVPGSWVLSTTILGSGTTYLGTILPVRFAPVLVPICTNLTYQSHLHRKDTIYHNQQYGTNIPIKVHIGSKLAIPRDITPPKNYN